MYLLNIIRLINDLIIARIKATYPTALVLSCPDTASNIDFWCFSKSERTETKHFKSVHIKIKNNSHRTNTYLRTFIHRLQHIYNKYF